MKRSNGSDASAARIRDSPVDGASDAASSRCAHASVTHAIESAQNDVTIAEEAKAEFEWPKDDWCN